MGRVIRRPRQSNDSEKEGPKPGRQKSPPFGDYRTRREITIVQFRHGSLRQTISRRRNSVESFFTHFWRYDGTGPDIFSRFMSFCMNPLRSSSLFHTRHGEGKEGKENGQPLQESITRSTGKGFVQRGIFVNLSREAPP